MAIRVVYRSHGGENAKDRPDYYSKFLGLLSFLRATEGMDLEIMYVNDGPIPDDRFRLMTATGETVELPRVGMRGSYRAALQTATSGRWSREDVVWFSEDDYLYVPEALERLLPAVAAHPEVDYFALYAGTPAHPLEQEPLPGDGDPRGWRQSPPVDVGGQSWIRVRQTSATGAARIKALREDRGIARLLTLPHRNMSRDHDHFKVLQG